MATPQTTAALLKDADLVVKGSLTGARRGPDYPGGGYVDHTVLLTVTADSGKRYDVEFPLPAAADPDDFVAQPLPAGEFAMALHYFPKTGTYACFTGRGCVVTTEGSAVVPVVGDGYEDTGELLASAGWTSLDDMLAAASDVGTRVDG